MSSPLEIIHGSELKAWQQQEGESALHYMYFRFYLELGPQRSIAETVKALLADDQVKRTPDQKTLSALQRDHRWQFRAELYDRWDLANQARIQAETRREKMRIELEEFERFQKTLGKDLSVLASKVLSKTDMAIDNSNDEDWTLDRATKFMQVLNTTATTAAGLWSEGLGVGELNTRLEELDSENHEKAYEAG